MCAWRKGGLRDCRRGRSARNLAVQFHGKRCEHPPVFRIVIADRQEPTCGTDYVLAMWHRGPGAVARRPATSRRPPPSNRPSALRPLCPRRRIRWMPTVNVATAVGWPAGGKPTPAKGMAVNAFATGLDHPRWLYVLPNGDVLVAETNAPPKPDDSKGIKGWIMKHGDGPRRRRHAQRQPHHAAARRRRRRRRRDAAACSSTG